MKNNIKKIGLILGLFIFSTYQTVQAQGDACATATVITPGTYSGTTVGFGADVAPTCVTSDGTGGGVWYSITGGTTCMAFTVDLCTGTAYDSRLRVFTGTCGTLVCVEGNDDFCAQQSQVTFNYTPGVVYYILVHGNGASQGAYTMNVTEVIGNDVTAPAPIPGPGTDDQTAFTNNTCMAAFSQADLAQSFIPSQNSICGAGIEFSAGAGSGDVTINLWDALPNVGGANLLATGTAAGTSGTFVDVTWPTVSIIPGNTYYLVFTGTDPSMCIAGDVSNGYSNGQVYANSGYGGFSSYDYTFHTFYGCGVAVLPDVSAPCSVSSIAAPSAVDDCAGIITGTPDVTFPINSSSVVTWTYDDGNGNTSTQTQNVIITDAIAPVADAVSLADTTGCLAVTPNAPTATDNCTGTVIGTPDVTFPVTAGGTTIVTWTFTDNEGNSSTQVQNVIINTVDIGVTVSGATLTADATAATVQWLDCDASYAMISAATNAAFTPSAVTGNYAVEVSQNGCVDTSACYLVDYTGLNDLSAIDIVIYPNPANGIFNVKFTSVNNNDLHIVIVDVQGRVVLTETLNNVKENQVQKIDISQEENGVYFIKILEENGIVYSKMITKI